MKFLIDLMPLNGTFGIGVGVVTTNCHLVLVVPSPDGKGKDSLLYDSFLFKRADEEVLGVRLKLPRAKTY